MKHLLLTTIAAVLAVGCGESQLPEPPTAKVPNISIYDAARRGDIVAVKQHIAAGTDVNVMKIVGLEALTPLRLAAQYNQLEVVELLIAEGADVNAKEDIYGRTPLFWAATKEGHKEIAEILITKGADVNVKSGDEETTPLHQAALYGHKEIAELLIANGADVNAKNDDGWTPLKFAVALKHRDETADLLRKHGGKTGAELKAEGK
jgi:ankyrin repeat protein